MANQTKSCSSIIKMKPVQEEQPKETQMETNKNDEDVNNIPSQHFQHIQNKLLITRIERRMFKIEQCYFNPQTLSIAGYHQLRSIPGQHWKCRLYTLFNDVNLPHYWVIDLWRSPSHQPNAKIPVIVYVQLITFQVKMFVNSILTEFFSNQNFPIDIMD